MTFTKAPFLQLKIIRYCLLPFKASQLLYIYHQFCLSKIPHSSCSVFICFVCISEKNSEFCPIEVSAIGFYNRESKFYCTIRTGSLNRTRLLLVLKGSSNTVLVLNFRYQFRTEMAIY